MLKRLRGIRRKNTVQLNDDKTEQELMKQLDLSKLPVHIAIIMDGNGRWALRQGMPRSFGHRSGVQALREIVRLSVEIKLKHLTVYAFSTENWKRPRDEINILMNLLVEYLHKEIDELCANNVKIVPVGMINDLPSHAQAAVTMATEKSKQNTGLTFNIALNYGGRAELLKAFKEIGTMLVNNQIQTDDIDEKLVSEHLFTSGQPDPDLLIRPSGDYRISNFLLWQLAYTEFWHTSTMWPDFGRKELLKALMDFQNRERRFGGLLL